MVSGSARGRVILAPPGHEVRPTTDRARQATFNALESRGLVADAVVVDLFAGSGAMAIEALSRGAARAVAVDSSPEAVRCIRANAEALGFADRLTAVRSDVMRWLASAVATVRPEPGRPLVVIADPPYSFTGWPALLEAMAPLVAAGGEEGVAVLEAPRPPDLPPGWELGRCRRYGLAWVTLAWPATGEAAPGAAPGADPPEAAMTETAMTEVGPSGD